LRASAQNAAVCVGDQRFVGMEVQTAIDPKRACAVVAHQTL